MKRIDLTCLIASPIMVGLLMQRGGGPPMAAATLAVLLWNVASWPAEVALLSYAQRRSPALAADRDVPAAVAAPGDIDAPAARGGGGIAAALRAQLDAWALYARQPAAAAALALALLYLTVMSWGTLMTAYLKALGMPEAELAAYRGCGPAAAPARPPAPPAPCACCAAHTARRRTARRSTEPAARPARRSTEPAARTARRC
jgi:iron-regulated transporter 1